jgi:hypothetical protein
MRRPGSDALGFLFIKSVGIKRDSAMPSIRELHARAGREPHLHHSARLRKYNPKSVLILWIVRDSGKVDIVI